MKSRSNTTVIILLVLDILLAAGLLAGALFFRHSSTYQIKKQMNLGVRFLDDLNYEEAILHFQKAIDIDPKEVQPHVNLINTYNRYAESMAKESPEKAISIYDDMIKSFQKMEEDLSDVNDGASTENQSSAI